MKYAWIDGERKAYPLPAMCETLAVSISAIGRGGAEGAQAQAAYRCTAARADSSDPPGIERCLRLTPDGTRVAGSGCPAPSRGWSGSCVRTASGHGTSDATGPRRTPSTACRCSESAGSELRPQAPNQAWSADSPTSEEEGWLYLAVVLDLLTGRSSAGRSSPG